jgi:hypothetical protein
VDCGPRALAVVLSSLKVDYDFVDLKKRFGSPERGGFSLASLDQVARSYGVQTLLAKSSLENLSRRKNYESFACICWLTEKHFLVCADYADSKVVIVDPPEIRDVPAATFAANWSGECLLVSRGSLMSESRLVNGFNSGLWIIVTLTIIGIAGATVAYRARKPVFLVGSILCTCMSGESFAQEGEKVGARDRVELRFSNPPVTSIDLGTARIGDKKLVTLVLRNDTEKVWKLRGVQMSCSCIGVEAPKRDIMPGESVEISANLSSSQGGERKASISFVFGESPNERNYQVPLMWKVTHALVTEPERLHFGEIGLAGKHEISFKVKRVKEGGESTDAKLTEVVASSKLLRCTFEGSVVKAEISDCGRESGEVAYIYVRDETMKPDQLIAFTVNWLRPPPEFISLPKEFTLSGDISKQVKFVIVAPRSNLAKISKVEVVGIDLAIKHWEEKRSSENRTQLSITFDSSVAVSENQKFSVEVTFDDSRVFHLFGSRTVK